MNEHIVVVTGSASVSPDVAALVPEAAIVLGVDAGLDHALAAGLRPSGLIGDLDSVSADGIAWAEEHATISRHPTDKDRTDTELALAFATDMSPARVTLIGGGDRLDHTIAALGALGAPQLTSVPTIDAWWGGQHIDVLHGPGRRTLRLEPGSTLSLLALRQRCRGVALSGVRWPLDDAVIEPTVGIGVSNEVVDPEGEVEVSTSDSVLTVFNRPALSPNTPSEDPS